MKTPPLVIFGLDAGDPDSLLAWSRQGLLPNIASILEGGTVARLVGPEMISVHGVWTSFFSGVSLQRHGYYLQRALVPGTYRLTTLHPRDIDAPPFWSCLLGRDRKVMIVDVPDTELRIGLNGFQLFHWGDHPTLARPSAYPAGLLEEIRAVVGPQVKTDERRGGRFRDRRILRRILRRIEKKGVLCRHLLGKDRCDLVVLMFGDSHAAGHRFRKYQLPDGGVIEGDVLERAVRLTYQAIDREIGLLLRRFSEPPNVFVVTNSGISDGYPIGGLMDSFCRQLGYQRLFEPSTLVGKALSLSRRAVPHRWRAARFGDGVDWAKTTAFAIPAYYTGYVRVNLKGREPLGVVNPGADYEALLDRLEADFHQLADEETGQAVVERVSRTAFGGGPPWRLPDLVVDWRPCSRLARRIVHPKTVLVPKKAGDPRGNYHSSTGLVLAAGPSIQKRGLAGDFSPLDFVPLFRALMGEPVGAQPPGEAVAAFTERKPDR